MINNALLDADISAGLFPTEKAVSFPSVDGETIELFCSNHFVQEKAIMVRVLEEKDDRILIKLPAEALNGTRIAVVSKDLVKSLMTA